jgi:hypothetical protein
LGDNPVLCCLVSAAISKESRGEENIRGLLNWQAAKCQTKKPHNQRQKINRTASFALCLLLRQNQWGGYSVIRLAGTGIATLEPLRSIR